MRALELNAQIDEKRILNIVLPADATPGPVRVLVLLPETDAPDNVRVEAGAPLLELIEKCQMHTGIEDLAHQHDHYLHGKAKKSG